MEERLQRQYDQLAAQSQRPSFWIDQESVAQMQPKMAGKYERYKARGLRMRADAGDRRHARILSVRNLDIGYDHPIMRDLNITLGPGERLRIHGRNGVGKSTLLKTILHQAGVYPQTTQVFGGVIEIGEGIRIGVYEQEISGTYLNMTLGEAVIAIYHDKNVPINDQKVRKLMSDYLFHPQDDYQVKVSHLSGGQKARLQLISMLAQQPNLLILDEPTNHLDLPSIEELEAALGKYDGAVLYVSHDSYFCHNIGGETLQIGAR
jgi:ATP-binding cassette subfamily F protein 3